MTFEKMKRTNGGRNHGPRTVAEIRDRDHRLERRAEYRPDYLDPTLGEIEPLFTSAKFDDCLTHITRYVTRYPNRKPRRANRNSPNTAHAWCGVMMQASMISLDDATGFACHACIARCEQLGLPTWSLVPDTGCAVSGGRRGRNLGRKHGPYAPREIYR